VRVAGGVASGLQRLSLRPGRYQVRLSAEAGVVGRDGVAFANVNFAAPGAEGPVCGGFMVVQGEGRQVRPSVYRRLAAGQPVMVATVLSASTLPVGVPVVISVTAPGSDTSLVFPVERPKPFGKGRWIFEITLPAPLPPGELELMLTIGDTPTDGCRVELIVER
jgi:hypothetical protein